MKSLSFSPVLFGVDLRLVGKDWVKALQLMGNWPVLRWLKPEFATRLRTAAGDTVYCVEAADGALPLSQAVKTPFAGVVLPDDLLLWHSLALPVLSSNDRKAAIELEIQRLNPFDPQHLIWTSVALPGEHHEQHSVLLGLTSRPLVESHLSTLSQAPGADVPDPANHTLATDDPAPAPAEASRQALPEIWVRMPGPDERYLTLGGFGETARQRRSTIWRIGNLLLVGLSLVVGLAVAVTPSLQLRERAREASSSFSTLQARATQAVQARQKMTELQDKVTQLQKLVGQRMVPEYMLLLITRYVPEDTYLLSLDIKGQTVSMTGTTPKATALVQHLSRQPGVRAVVSKQPARREGARDSFNIEWILQPVDQTPQAAEPTAAATAPAPVASAPSSASTAQVTPPTAMVPGRPVQIAPQPSSGLSRQPLLTPQKPPAQQPVKP